MRLVYHDNKKLPFNDLLKVTNSAALPQGNLETLATEIFKVKNELTPKTMTRILKLKNLVRIYILTPIISTGKISNLLSNSFNLGPTMWDSAPPKYQKLQLTSRIQEYDVKETWWLPLQTLQKLHY